MRNHERIPNTSPTSLPPKSSVARVPSAVETGICNTVPLSSQALRANPRDNRWFGSQQSSIVSRSPSHRATSPPPGQLHRSGKNLFRIPVLGTILRNTYVMPINRDSAGTESVREAVRRMDAGFLVGVFPEGTRSADGKLGEIKPGFVALARRAKQPIYPVGIAGADRAMPKGGLKIYPKKIRVIFGEPIPADEVVRLSKKGNEEEFLNVIHDRLQECLDEANAWYDS